MSLIQVERNLLLTPLQAVSGVVERRHTLPILSNVLLELGEQAISLTATDLEIQVSSQAEIAVATEHQLTTVSARKLHDILRSLPDGSSVSFLERLLFLARLYRLRSGPSGTYAPGIDQDAGACVRTEL